MIKPKITMAPAKSSNVESTGYDSASKTLAVKFKGGKTYHYTDVPAELHSEMGKADSIGKFIGAKIVGKFKHH